MLPICTPPPPPKKKKKKSFAFDVSQFGMTYLMMFIMPQFLSIKKLTYYLFNKAFPS